jgi:hypothetical protein
LAFYYMHNLNLTDEERALRDVGLDLRKSSSELGGTGEELTRLLRKMRGLSAFKGQISRWAQTLVRA